MPKPKKEKESKTKEKSPEEVAEEVEKDMEKEEEEVKEKAEEVIEEKPEEKEEKKPKKKPKKVEPKAKIDYKVKFSESTREAQKIATKNKKINEAIDKAGDIKEPTDDEMARMYPDWDLMDDPVKKLAKESEIGKRFRENLAKAREETKEIEKWDEEVKNFAEDPESLVKHPELEGKMDEFSIYATDVENTSIPFRILVPAFLHDLEEKKAEKPKNKGNMFESGTGGPEEKPKEPGKISLDEAMKLKKVDYGKYKELLIAGKIEEPDL